TAVIVAPRPPASERDQSGAVPPGPGHLRKGHHDNVMPVDLIAPRDVSDALLGIRQGPLRRPVSTTMSRGVDHDRTRRERRGLRTHWRRAAQRQRAGIADGPGGPPLLR